MILAALVLLASGTCPWIPNFATGGVDCTPANQLVECRCSECFTWTAPGGVVSYTVERTSQDGTTRTMFLMSTLNEDGVVFAPQPIYCPVKHDAAMPIEGRAYSYRVKGCNGYGCALEWSPSIGYRAAPYAYVFHPPTQGN